MKITISWDITPCSPLKVNRRFEGKYRFHLQGRKISRARNLLYASQYLTERVGAQITLLTCFREVLGSNTVRDKSYHARLFVLSAIPFMKMPG
jgi:hypothetical protein